MGETQANTTTAAATTTIKVATTQIEPVWFDLEGTVKKTIDLIGEASHNGAQLIAFPEVWIPGYPGFVWLYNFTEQVSSPLLSLLPLPHHHHHRHHHHGTDR